MINLIPAPKKCVQDEGSFVIAENQKVKSEFDLPLLSNIIAGAELCNDNVNADFIIVKDDSLADEGYMLSVNANGIAIKAKAKIGVYYALQSIRKIGKIDLGKRAIPCCEIDDEPVHSWRGVQIDESRHFFGINQIKKMLDIMFLEKLNVFHWHLTDDQGWRIEIKKYPLLTEIGSKRSASHIGGWGSKKIDKTPHSGYYTQEQITEIIEYARERGIMIVPEIDFPAHCASALAAYSYLACRDIKTEVPYYFGGIIPKSQFNFRWNRTVCCGKETTFEFIFNVLDEVCELFDAPYLHMGGDEAPQNEWHSCKKCRAVMKQNGLKNESELQGWFENRVSEYLKSKGKKLIAWNDVLIANNLNKDDKNVVIQYWTPKRDERAEAYVNSGGEAILSNHRCFYFDMTYAEIPLNQTYNFDPADFGMKVDSKGVLGYEGELWSEWIADNYKLEMNAFPRLQALSEVAWSPKEQRNYTDFKKRLDAYKPVLDALGIVYACDEVALPSSKKQILKIRKKFHKGNPYMEVELNKEHKFKGDK